MHCLSITLSRSGFSGGLSFRIQAVSAMVDVINPALPIIRNIP